MTITKKIQPPYFELIANGKKQFELRLADFKIKPDDFLILKEWDPETRKYTGREIKTRATYVLKSKDCPFWPEQDVQRFGYQIIQLGRDPKFPRGVEIVTAAVIQNSNGEFLIAKSPKWKNKWSLPGGHIEPGETILKSAAREAYEETGLKLKPIQIIRFDEIINSRDFHRPAHFVYFEILFRYQSGKINLDQHELSRFKWIKPEAALKLNLNEATRETFRNLTKNNGPFPKKI